MGKGHFQESKNQFKKFNLLALFFINLVPEKCLDRGHLHGAYTQIVGIICIVLPLSLNTYYTRTY